LILSVPFRFDPKETRWSLLSGVVLGKSHAFCGLSPTVAKAQCQNAVMESLETWSE
jgi:hypothetical protein